MKYWSEAEQRAMVHLFESGEKVSDIAAELGLQRIVVSNLLHSLGVVNAQGYKPKKGLRKRLPYTNYWPEREEQEAKEIGESKKE